MIDDRIYETFREIGLERLGCKTAGNDIAKSGDRDLAVRTHPDRTVQVPDSPNGNIKPISLADHIITGPCSS